MSVKARAAILALLLAAPSQAARAVRPPASAAPPPLGHRAWNSESGLPQNSVQAILQTSDGFLWIATQSGLARFDGIRFQVFEPATSPGLPDLDVRSLAEAKDGTLWIATSSGLASYRGGVFRAVAMEKEEPPVFALKTAPDGTVWGGTEGAVLRIESGGPPVSVPVAVDPAVRIRALAWDTGGRLLLGTWEGLRRLRSEESLGAPALPDSAGWVTAILAESDGTTWVGTSTGLYRIPPGGSVRAVEEQGFSGNPIRALLRARNGDLWAGTRAGLFRLRRQGPGRFEKADEPGDDSILSLLEDREGNIWAGGERGGVHRLKEDRVALYGRRQGLTDEFVWTVFADSLGRLWAGTDDGLIARRDPGSERFTVVQSLGARVMGIAEDSRGALWVATAGRGLVRLDARGPAYFGTRDGLGTDSITALLPEKDGGLWVATAGAGLRRWTGKRFVPAAGSGVLPYPFIRALAPDKEGGIWIGSYEGGVGLYRDGKLTRYHRSDGLAQDSVHCMAADMEGTVWVGTGAGLSRFRDSKWTTWRRPDGLLDEQIASILDDRRGSLWLATNRGGLYRISLAELDAFARGRTRVIRPAAFVSVDGPHSGEGNNGAPGAVSTRDGRLWFAMSKGVASIDPQRLPKNPVPPAVAIESLLADGSALAPGERAAAGHGALEVHYTGLSFRMPEQVRFRYRLKGFEEKWTDAGTRRTAYYTNLPPRRFTFEVAAINEDGIASERPASRTFSLAPHFTQTPWFYVAVVLAAAAAIFVAHRYRAAQLTARERLRTALTEAQLHALRQQLRPHFLFNTLNTLLPLIEENPELARNTVYRLADLLRLNLKTEPEQSIALETEIDMLDRYLAIERMRFGDRLEVSIEIDPEVRQARVPTFLLQPLVENAIKHGIGKNPGSERITLSARRDDGRLWIEIRNDGIGPASSRSPATHGIGLKNTRERLQLLYGSDHQFDLALTNGSARLSIAIPLTFATPGPIGPAARTE
ncbi:MAG TPA: two-component regulator propeller domain-containing protein [Thermoanaerobaculia bacterium]|nr:two-component regulator propeller domain-containing protein [Thermoanaerobaculia bacterium]